MKFGSVCSGIEAASVAWKPLGFEATFFSEIEAFPSALLSHYYPNVQNLGDMNDFKRWPDYELEILCGGTPCQSFSVAGLRKGLSDPNGNLALVYLAVADRYRPRWLLWENVPGVMSSNGGRDFGSFIGALGELGYGYAWRVLDAQYVRVDGLERAVPQRRRRVFVVGYLGDWRRAAAVLFERESMCGSTPPRREAREVVAASLTSRLGRRCGQPDGGGTKGHLIAHNISDTMGIRSASHTSGLASESKFLVAHSLRADGFDASEDGTGRGTPLIAFGHQEDRKFKASSEIFSSLTSSQGLSVQQGYAVRRLMPLECERLQGFPDNYTAIRYRNKPAIDGPRYKALGNSMAINCMRWLGQRIAIINSIKIKRRT